MGAMRTEAVGNIIILATIALLTVGLYYAISLMSSKVISATRLIYDDRPVALFTHEADCERILSNIRNDRRHLYRCREAMP